MRETLRTSLEVLKDKCKKYELQTLEGHCESLKSDMNDFSLKVLFVGGFSAGKSAIINSFLKRDLLQEGQRPETAIASELVYDNTEYIEAVGTNHLKRFNIDEADKINIDEYNHLVWHINCENLNMLKDTSIVDMPGFNSGVKEHNKAILQYSQKGNAYVFVIDCEDGVIKQNMKNFIDEIKNYDDNLGIVITKTDLKLPDDVEKIKKRIKSDADLLFGKDVPIITTSKFDDNAQDKIEKIISLFDKDKIFGHQFSPKIYDIGLRCIDSMEIYKKSINLNLSQFDDEISKREKSKIEITNKFNKEKSRLERNFKNNVAPSIIADVENALNNNTDTLARALSSGEKNFSVCLNNILRPILVTSTEKNVQNSFDKFISDIDISDMDVDDSLKEISSDLLEKYKESGTKIDEIYKTGGNFNGAYKTITTALSVIYNLISPLLELVIIFLPDILKVFSKENKQEKLKNKVSEQIIPDIISRLQPEIEKSLVEIKEDLIEKAQVEFSNMIDLETEALKIAKANKEKATQEFKEKVDNIDSDITEVRDILNKIAR